MVKGAKFEMNLVRGWMMVFDPMVMRLLPVMEALSAMVTDEEREVGVLGPDGIVEARLEDDILRWICAFDFGSEVDECVEEGFDYLLNLSHFWKFNHFDCDLIKELILQKQWQQFLIFTATVVSKAAVSNSSLQASQSTNQMEAISAR